MKEFFKSLYTNKKRLVLCIIVLLIAGYFIYEHYNAPASQTSYVLGQASKQTIITSVSGTGQVSQDRTVNITSPGSGKLTSVNVKQGQAVKAGQTIAVLDQTNNTIALNQANAALASAQASYDQTLAGATSQSIQLAQLAVQSDQQALANASSSLATVTQQQSQSVANAFSNLMNSSLQTVPYSNNLGTGVLAISGTYSGSQTGIYTVIVYNTGGGLQYAVSGLENSTGALNKSIPLPLGTKGLYFTLTGNPYSNDSWTISVPNTLASNYSSNQNAYQTALTNQGSALQTAQQQITSAQNKLQQDEINLQVQQQPPTSQQIESAKASLTNAEAQLQNAQITYNNNILTAPFDGTVAQLNNQVGDLVTPSTNVATVVTSQSIAIIPLNEVDVANVKLGDKATMTFNAVDGLTITGTVAQIDNIGTVNQGVVSYNVKIAFDTEDPRIKPGMSVNVSVITNIAADVLTVPSSAVQTQGTNSVVLKLDPSQTQTVAGQTGVIAKTAPVRAVVQTGVSDGSNTQILSGLNEGDSIVIQSITITSTKSAASSATSVLRLGGGGGFGGGAGGGAVRATTGGGGAAPRAGGN